MKISHENTDDSNTKLQTYELQTVHANHSKSENEIKVLELIRFLCLPVAVYFTINKAQFYFRNHSKHRERKNAPNHCITCFKSKLSDRGDEKFLTTPKYRVVELNFTYTLQVEITLHEGNK